MSEMNAGLSHLSLSGKKRTRHYTYMDKDFQSAQVCETTQRKWKKMEAMNVSSHGTEEASPESCQIGTFLQPCASAEPTSKTVKMEIDSDAGSSTEGEDVADPDEKNRMRHDLLKDKTIMFDKANLTTSEVLVIIMSFSTRFSLSYEARQQLIEMTKCFAGPSFQDWSVSNYYLKQAFDAPDHVISHVFYCDSCPKELESSVTKKNFRNHAAVCQNCNKEYELTMSSRQHFLSIDFKYQIETLLAKDNVREAISNYMHTIEERSNNDGLIRDVHDGILYKKLLKNLKEGKLSEKEEIQLLTFIFNTDGAPVNHSTKDSFYPIFAIINELPPALRFKYRILIGLWIGDREPNPALMNLFLKSFVEQAKPLSESGFVSKHKVGCSNYLVVKPLVCSVDTVARAIVQNRISYSGFYGCSWCDIHGTHEGAVRFITTKNEGIKEASLRNHKSYLQNVDDVLKLGKPVNGVKGFSVLSELHGFDMIWGFAREYQHGDCLGNAERFWSLWTEPRRASPIRLSKADIGAIDKRLMSITPPKEIHRLPRSIVTHKSVWKASEWRSWMIFYAAPCLSGILDERAFQHFTLFCKSMYILLQSTITVNELRQCAIDLRTFVDEIEVIYGTQFMSFNMHTLKHAVASVANCGPSWAHSTFPFEDGNFHLKSEVNGPVGVYDQMARGTLSRNEVQCAVDDSESEACMVYYHNLFSPHRVRNVTRCSENVVFVGVPMYSTDCLHFSEYTRDNEVKFFDRCIYNGTSFHSVLYERPERRDDTVVLLQCGTYARILKFACIKEKFYAEVAVLEIEINPNGALNLKHLVKVRAVKNDHRLVRGAEILEKCIIMNIENVLYISRMPNNYEIQ